MMVMLAAYVEGRSWALSNLTDTFGGQTVNLGNLSSLRRVELDH